MKRVSIKVLEERVLEIAKEWSNTDGVDIVNKKSHLLHLLMQDEVLDLDEINNISSSYVTIEFNIVRKGGRINRETGSRTGSIKQSLVVKLKFRKFCDGEFAVEIDLEF